MQSKANPRREETKSGGAEGLKTKFQNLVAENQQTLRVEFGDEAGLLLIEAFDNLQNEESRLKVVKALAKMKSSNADEIIFLILLQQPLEKSDWWRNYRKKIADTLEETKWKPCTAIGRKAYRETVQYYELAQSKESQRQVKKIGSKKESQQQVKKIGSNKEPHQQVKKILTNKELRNQIKKIIAKKSTQQRKLSQIRHLISHKSNYLFTESCTYGFPAIQELLNSHTNSYWKESWVITDTGCPVARSEIDPYVDHQYVSWEIKETDYSCPICHKVILHTRYPTMEEEREIARQKAEDELWHKVMTD
jgi:hypothetical protein